MAHQPNPSNDPAGSQTHIPNSGMQFFIKVDGDTVTFDHQKVTGKEILLAAGRTCFQDFDLYQKLTGGGRDLVGPDDPVDLLADGIEKFHSIPKKRTDGKLEGLAEMPAPLTLEDISYLNSLNKKYDFSNWEGNLLLRIYDWPVPDGYNVSLVNVALVIPITYPSAQIDMFYFFPVLQRNDNVSLKAITTQIFNGQSWQRWSRHRTPESVWRVGFDDVGTHLALMDACLRDEAGRAQ